MRTRNKDYDEATRPAGTGTSDHVASGDKTKPTNSSPIFATWNVRTLIQPESRALLADSLSNHNIRIACIQETRVQGDPSEIICNTNAEPSHKLFNSGHPDNRGLHGVAIVIDIKLSSCIMAWNPVSARLCYLRVAARHVALSVICAYAPTEEASQTTRMNSTSSCKHCSLKRLERTF